MGEAQQCSITKSKWHIRDWAGSEDTSKLHEEVTRMSKVSHSCFTTFSLPACTYGHMRSSLSSDDIGREDSNMVYRWFYTICWHYTKWKTMILHPFLEHSWRAMVKGNPSKVSTTLESVPGCLFYLEGEYVKLHTNSWAVTNVWLTVRDSEETQLEN